MSASVLGYLGLLLAHKPFLERCNIIKSDKLNDAWYHNKITNRKQFKTIMRQLYGSTMSASQMWDDMDIPYTPEEVVAFNEELQNGSLKPAMNFKAFIMKHCNPQPTMYLNVMGEIAKTECNHHFNRGEVTQTYDIYDTASKSIKRLKHTKTVKVPDLQRFRRYMVTGLIHRLDGLVEDNTVYHLIKKYGWGLPIHDATICCCESADYVRDVYCNGTNEHEPSLKHIFNNRKKILSEYFQSIGIESKAIIEWNTEVISSVEEINEFEFNPMVLK